MTANLCCGNAFLWLIVVNSVWEGSQREMFISKPILINELQEINLFLFFFFVVVVCVWGGYNYTWVFPDLQQILL